MSLPPVITLLEPIHEQGTEILRAHATLHELTGPEDPNLPQALAASEGLIVRSTRIDATLLAQAPQLRVIGRHGAGLDNIDLDYAQQHGIQVVNTPRSNTNSVAEYVITTALMLLKRIPAVETALRTKTFSHGAGSLPGQVQRNHLVGREALGTRLGLIGAGAIGQSVASKAQALGMSVSALDPFLPAEVFDQVGIKRIDHIEDLLKNIDILSVHVPGGEEPVITANLLDLLPSHAIVINAARGNVIDEVALAHALTRGSIGAATVDVFSQEPPEPDHPLLQAPNTIVTPHMAAMTEEALERMATDVAHSTLEALNPQA